MSSMIKSMRIENEGTGNICLTFKEYDSILTGDTTEIIVKDSYGNTISTMTDLLSREVKPRDGYYLMTYK